MSRLLKKQHELEEQKNDEKSKKAETEQDEELNSEYYAIGKEEVVDQGPSESEVASWVNDMNENAEPVFETNESSKTNEDVFNDILNEVIASSECESDEEIAMKVQSLYEEYVNGPQINTVAEEKEDENPISEIQYQTLDLNEPETVSETEPNIVSEAAAKAESETVEAEIKTDAEPELIETEAEEDTYAETEQTVQQESDTQNVSVIEESSAEEIQTNQQTYDTIENAEGAQNEQKSEITISEPVPDDRKSEESEDDILLAALGYTTGNRKPEQTKSTQKKPFAGKLGADLDNALAYVGKEYKSHKQDEEIRKNYESEKKILEVRAFGTVLFALLAIVLDLFGKKFTGAFSAANFPIANIMFAFQMLVLCAAFSYKQLWNGIVALINAHPIPSSITACVVVATSLYNVILAAALRISGANEFMLYNSGAVACLCIQVLADWLRLKFEMKNFKKLSSFDSVCTLQKGEEGAYVLHKGSFSEGYFRRTNRYNHTFVLANYAIAPVVAVSLIAFIIAIASSRGFVGALGTFVVCVQVSLPVFAVFALDIPFYIMNFTRPEVPSVILNIMDTEDFGKIDKIVLHETDMFKDDCLEIRSFRNCVSDGDFYSDLSAVSAICDKVGGTISRAFRNVSVDAGNSSDVDSENIVINLVKEGGIDAEYNGKRYILGSADFLMENGIPCHNCNDEEWQNKENGGVVFHIAVDKREILRFFMVYKADKEFCDTLLGLSEADIATELCCLDPNLNPGFIEKLVGNDRLNLTVVRIENSEKKDNDDKKIDAGLISDGKDWMAAVALADMCKNYNPIAALNRKILVGIEAVVCLLAFILSVLGVTVGMSPAIVLLVYVLTLIPSFILSRFI